MATRDSCMQRQSFKKSLDLWLAVLREANVVSIEDPGFKILCSYLVGQTQSAFCERTFAQVVEIQKLVRLIFWSPRRTILGSDSPPTDCNDFLVLLTANW